MREKAIENQIKKCLTALGKNVWFFKHAASASMKVGIPDIICCIKGGALNGSTEEKSIKSKT